MAKNSNIPLIFIIVVAYLLFQEGYFGTITTNTTTLPATIPDITQPIKITDTAVNIEEKNWIIPLIILLAFVMVAIGTYIHLKINSKKKKF